jgi:uncharacterized protein (TIGR00369 family)
MTELTESATIERTRTVTWTDPREVAGTATGRSGLDFLESIAAGEVPAPPIAVLLGMTMEHIEPGQATFGLTVGEHLYNPIGSVHGGVFATLLDSAMGCAVQSTLAAGQGYTTVDLVTHYVRPLTVEVPRVLAIGTVVSAGRRVATATGRIEDEAGKLYAHGSTTCLIMGSPPA